MDDIFQFIDREVWIVTAADGERRGGLVATWVQLSSLDPAEPIVTVSIGENHFTRELVDASGAFALHLLADNQSELAFNFCCDSGRDRDKLRDVPWKPGETGAPLLASHLAQAECRVIDRIEVAGRVLYFADLVNAHRGTGDTSLREHALFSAANPDQLASLKAGLQADIGILGQAIRKWRASAESRSPQWLGSKST